MSKKKFNRYAINYALKYGNNYNMKSCYKKGNFFVVYLTINQPLACN